MVRINGSQAPFAADHIIDALGEPTILTLDRDILRVVRNRRRANARAYRRENGPVPEDLDFQIDEVPPAATLESDRSNNPNVSTRPIPASDNESGGGQFPGIINNYGVTGKLPDGTNIDFFATEANYSTGITKLIGQYGTDAGEELVVEVSGNTVLYGLGGSDRIFGERGVGGDDVLIGGSGDDEIRGRRGDDILLGGSGRDRIYGGSGEDDIIGGAGNDYLRGGSGSDDFYLDTGIGADFIDSFSISDDLVVLPSSLVDGIEVRDDGQGIGELINELASSLDINLGSSFANIASLSAPVIRAIFPASGIYYNDELIGVVGGLDVSTLESRIKYIG